MGSHHIWFTGVHRLIIALIGLAFLASCERPPELIGIDNPEVPVASVPNAARHKIFLASTRQASEVVGAFYSEQRAPQLGLASVEVSIPPTHEPGNLERPRRLPPDPRTEFAIVAPTVYENDAAFVASVDRALAAFPPGQRDILFFVHGYNNTTSDALLMLAQFVEDSGFEGVPILFDWASAAKLSRYVYDLNSALVARPRLEEIGRLLDRTQADGYDVFAHSMGGFLVMEAMQNPERRRSLLRTGRLRNVVLASPDIDIDLFRTQLQEVRGDIDQIFVLLSKDDRALNLSRRLAGGVPRVGAADAENLAKLGVIAIDLSEIDDSNTGSHSKFTGSPEVVQLLGMGLNNNTRTFDRRRATQLEEVLEGVPIQIVFE